jgi:predicted N-acetyltransferase YhbS
VSFTDPEPLSGLHRLERFDSSVPTLDRWLRHRARGNQTSGATRTFVVSDSDEVVAYYSLAAGGVGLGLAPTRFRRNMPDPIPVVVLARLAVDRRFHGARIGRGLIKDCAARVVRVSESLGVRGVVVHAISEEAQAFYEAVGFRRSTLEPRTLMVSVDDLRAFL